MSFTFIFSDIFQFFIRLTNATLATTLIITTISLPLFLHLFHFLLSQFLFFLQLLLFLLSTFHIPVASLHPNEPCVFPPSLQYLHSVQRSWREGHTHTAETMTLFLISQRPGSFNYFFVTTVGKNRTKPFYFSVLPFRALIPPFVMVGLGRYFAFPFVV